VSIKIKKIKNNLSSVEA